MGAESIVPRGHWRDVGGFVSVVGSGTVRGGYGSTRVPIQTEHMATCQRCGYANVPLPLVLWTRFEEALDRQMYWFSPEPGPHRPFCAGCPGFGEEPSSTPTTDTPATEEPKETR